MAGFSAQTRMRAMATRLVTEGPLASIRQSSDAGPMPSERDDQAPQSTLRELTESRGGRLDVDVQELAEEFGFPRISSRRAQQIEDALAQAGLRTEPRLGVGVARVALCVGGAPAPGVGEPTITSPPAAPAARAPVVAARASGFLRAPGDGEGERAAVAAECERRDWTVDTPEGMGLEGALEALDAGRYDTLVVARLATLSNTAIDVYRLMDRAHRHGWDLICLEPLVDTTSEEGATMAATAGAFARLERELVTQRRKVSAAGGRARRGMDPETRELIIRLHEEGRDDHDVAELLDADGVPSPSGRGWTDKAVAKVVEQHRRAAAQAQAGAASSSAMRSRSSRADSSVNGPRPE